jgi:hypothetical protein
LARMGNACCSSAGSAVGSGDKAYDSALAVVTWRGETLFNYSQRSAVAAGDPHAVLWRWPRAATSTGGTCTARGYMYGATVVHFCREVGPPGRLMSYISVGRWVPPTAVLNLVCILRSTEFSTKFTECRTFL